jgi:hypothetical protein
VTSTTCSSTGSTCDDTSRKRLCRARIWRTNVIATRHAGLVSDEEHPRYELACQVALNVAAGLAGYAGAGAGALAAGAVPVALTGIDYIIGKRRLAHEAETLVDGADAFGADTPDEFIEFLKAAVSDEEHQELLARALTIAQDTAFRDKRRALGRALASAASDTGTRVDDELQFIRVIADLDEPHIRLLRLMSTVPEHLTKYGDGNIRQWFPWSIGHADPGLADSAWALLAPLQRHGLVYATIGQYHTPVGTMENQYEITGYGEWFLTRLAEPEAE